METNGYALESLLMRLHKGTTPDTVNAGSH